MKARSQITPAKRRTGLRRVVASLLLVAASSVGISAYAEDTHLALEPFPIENLNDTLHKAINRASHQTGTNNRGENLLAANEQSLGEPPSGKQSAANLPENNRAAIDQSKTCRGCHNGNHGAGQAILQSVHGVAEDSRTPFADQGCITCHGPSLEHRTSPVGGAARALPDITFGGDATPPTTQNTQCLQCHQRDLTAHWRGSIHEAQNLTCTSCHTVHARKDPILDKRSQPQLCLTCHQEKRAQMLRPSSHPLRDGQMACTDCHNPHGSTGPQQLVKGTVNETCYTCHAEKRGPFLWEHAPVREDCTICHQPHGSVHQAMLKNRTPWLCQQCHLAQFHPSTAYSGTGLPTDSIPSGAQQMLGKNCLNCHSAVHGSNHPAGARKTR